MEKVRLVAGQHPGESTHLLSQQSASKTHWSGNLKTSYYTTLKCILIHFISDQLQVYGHPGGWSREPHHKPGNGFFLVKAERGQHVPIGYLSGGNLLPSGVAQ